MARDAQIQMRRDTAANWTTTNPTLADGEYGIETNTGYIKVGDGSTAWTSLPYAHSRFMDAWMMQPSAGWDVVPRWNMTSNRTLANGIVNFAAFVPGRTFTATQILMATVTGGTDTGAGTTTRRMGLYTLNGSSATLVARTASDATLFNAAQTYQKSFDTAGGYPSSYTLTAGSTYAIAAICYNTGGTFGQPTVGGFGGVSSSTVTGLAPVLGGFITAQTDLPAGPSTLTHTTTASPWARIS